MTPPDWAVKFRRLGNELRRVNDALYNSTNCMSAQVCMTKKRNEHAKLRVNILDRLLRKMVSRNSASGYWNVRLRN